MRQETDDEESSRHQQHRPKGKLVVNVEEEREIAKQRHRVGEEFLYRGQHGILYLLRIIHCTCHRIATTLLGEIA